MNDFLSRDHLSFFQLSGASILKKFKENLRLFLNFKSVKGPESEKEKNRKSGIRAFEILPDVMS